MRRLVPWLAVFLFSCQGEIAPQTIEDDLADKWESREDPSYEVDLSNAWVLKGDGLTDATQRLSIVVFPPEPVKRIRGAIDGGRAKTAEAHEDGSYTLELDVSELDVGAHRLQLAASYSKFAFATRELHVSYPLYTVVSTDFDDTRFGDDVIARMKKLRDNHEELRYSHFFAPYHFTDPEVAEERKKVITDWVRSMHTEHGDELGVHIHCWCHFVEAAGVKCNPTDNFAPGDDSGYITVLASYPEDEMKRMLDFSVELFAQHQLGRPTSFRAGGWTADLSTLRALERSGFTVDSSALPAERIRASWGFFRLYTWNAENWQGIDERSQPYYPSLTAITKAESPQFGLLEVPDNGVLVDYVTGEEMIAIYDMNAVGVLGGPELDRSTMYQVGFHPPNFSDRYLARMDQALGHVDQHLYSRGLGPVRYATLTELRKAFVPPARAPAE